MGRKRASRVLSSGAGKHTDCVELVPIGRSEICLTAGEGLAADGVVAVFQDYGIVPVTKKLGTLGLGYINVADEELAALRKELSRTMRR